MSAFDELRRAAETARRELDGLVAPAGLHVVAVQPDGDEWLARLAKREPARLPNVGAPASGTPVGRSSGEGAELPGTAPRRSPGTPPQRAGAESLSRMLDRAGAGSRIARETGPGGLRGNVPTTEERLRWLAATLVGDTVLALRHSGEAEDGPGAHAELQRQLRLFLRESERSGEREDAAPFLAALDAWMPPGFPRGQAFLSAAEVPRA